MKHILAIMLLVIVVGSISSVYSQDDTSTLDDSVKEYINRVIEHSLPDNAILSDTFKEYPSLEIAGIVESVWITDIKSNDNMVILGFGIAKDQTVNVGINDEIQEFTFNINSGLFQERTYIIPLDRIQGLTLQMTSGDESTEVITLLESTPVSTENIKTLDDSVKNHINRVIQYSLPDNAILSDTFKEYPSLEISGIVESVWITDIKSNDNIVILGFGIAKDQTVNVGINDEIKEFTFNINSGLFQERTYIIPLDRIQGLTLQITSGDESTEVITVLKPTTTQIDDSAPILNSISDITITEGDTKQITISLSNDSADTEYSITAPNFVTLSGDTITASPISGLLHDSYLITVKATNSIGSDTETFLINIKTAPTKVEPEKPTITITAISDQTVTVGNTVEFTVSANISDNSPLTYSLETSQENAKIDSDGKFTWIPTETQTGTHKIIIKVSDENSQSDSLIVNITVKVSKAIPIMTELPVSTLIFDLDYFEFVGFTNMTNYEVYDGNMGFNFTTSSDLTASDNLPVGTVGEFKWTAHTQNEKSGFTIDNQADFESKITIVKDYPYIEITPQTVLGDKAERIFLHFGT